MDCHYLSRMNVFQKGFAIIGKSQELKLKCNSFHSLMENGMINNLSGWAMIDGRFDESFF
jgi:hypothetical protein